MSKRTCIFEAQIVAAVRSDGPSEEQLAHMSSCEECREAAAVSSWLGEAARRTEKTTSVPAAETIWWRAQVVRKLCDQDSRMERRTRPLVLTQIAAMLLAVVTGIGLLLTSESVLEGIIGSLGSLVGGNIAAVLAVAAVASLASGALVAWQAARELG